MSRSPVSRSNPFHWRFTMKSAKWGPVLCVFIASLLFSTGGLLIKLIPWQPLAINGVRNLIGAAVIGIYLLVTHHRLVFSRSVWIGAVSMIGVTTLYAIANKMTTAANAIVLQFTAPVFVILLMAVIFHSKPDRVEIFTCLLVLTGVILFFVDGLQAGNWLGNLIAVLSGICYAGVFMMNSGKNADAISSCFLGQLAAGIIFTPTVFQESDFSPAAVAAVICLGAFQVGLAYVFFSIGIKKTPAVTASLITGLEPVLNPILVAVFYGEMISTLSVFGAVLVVGTIIAYNVYLARKPS